MQRSFQHQAAECEIRLANKLKLKIPSDVVLQAARASAWFCQVASLPLMFHAKAPADGHDSLKAYFSNPPPKKGGKKPEYQLQKTQV